MRDFRKSDKFIFDFEKGGWVLNTNYGADALGYNQSVASDFSIARDDDEFFRHNEDRSRTRSAWNFLLAANLLEGSKEEGFKRRRKSAKKIWRRYYSTYIDQYEKHPLTKTQSNGWGFPEYDIEASKPRETEGFERAVRKLPKDICSDCKYRPACSSWIDGRIVCGGIRPCLKLQGVK